MSIDYPFYDRQPGPERREKLNDLYAAWESAVENAKGWSPLIRLEADGSRRVAYIYDWTGGIGEKPQLGYLGEAGIVSNKASATDLRGTQGLPGVGGDLMQILGGFDALNQTPITDTDTLLGGIGKAQGQINKANSTLSKAVLSYPDYATAEAAAATLPDGQSVEVTDVQERYEVQSGSLVFVSALPDKKLSAFVVPEMFGKTDTPVNTAAALNAAATYCRANTISLRAGAKAYTLGADVNLRSVKLDFSACSITVNDGFLLTIGGNAATTINPEQIFGIVKKPRAWSFIPDDYTTPTVRCIGAKGQTIRISHVDRIQFFQSTDPATYPSDASQAYSKFYIDFACIIGVDTDPEYAGGSQADGAGSANQWFNENQFFLGRCIHFYYRGSYTHNNNRVYGGCFETSNSHVEVAVGNKNFFYDLRLEGEPKVTFGENTLGNVIEFTWFSSTAQIYEDTLPVGTVIDDGALNIVKDARLSSTASDRVLTVSVQDTVFNGQPGNYNARQATLRAIRSVNRSSLQPLADTGFIEVSKGDYLFFGLKSLEGLESRYVAQIRSYDKNFNLISGNAANFETSNFINVYADFVQGSFSSNAKHSRAGILSADIKYIRIDILSYGNASFDNALEIFCNHVSRTPGRNRRNPLNNTKRGYFGVCTAAPTKFLGRIGDIAAGTTADYRCIYALETTLVDEATGSATQLRLTSFSLSGFGSVQIGDLIGIDLDDGTTHWTTVSAVGGGLHTITAALPSGAAAGSRVYVSRLAVR